MGVDPERLPEADRCIAAADPAHWARVIRTARRYGCHFTLGIHPWFDTAADCLDRIEALDPDGLGEIGLDRVRSHPRQAELARLQLARADRPVVLHCVRAHDDLLGLLKATDVRAGLVHAWTGSLQQAQRFVDQGLHLSFGPALLRSPKIQDAARWCPAERLLVETDGETTEGLSRLDAVLACLAALRQVEVDTLITTTATNARTLFPRSLR